MTKTLDTQRNDYFLVVNYKHMKHP
jgi:hypothetical protein